MKPISFQEVAKLVNRISGTRIDIATPVTFVADQYAVYGGAVSSSGFFFEFEILYLYAGATKDGLRDARLFIDRKTDISRIRVVYAPSITPSIIDDFKNLKVQCSSLADYFLSFMSQQTEAYISKIKALSFEDYIDPQIETPRGHNSKTPNPVLSFMLTPEPSTPVGEVAVLLGEPGQGKTHMSKYLAKKLIDRKHIPVYVHSEQWTRMQTEDLSSIWKTIVASFRYFDAPIGWAEGVEREFVRVSLRLGIFRLIFDGFDEFVLWNRGAIDPVESLQELINLADETGTTLCITSRTSFWKSEIEDAEENNSELNDTKPSIYTFTICPFDVNHAKNYFIKRFGEGAEDVTASVRLFERLKKDSSNDAISFVGRGFFLSLIADLVKRGFDADHVGKPGQTRLQWIMQAMCQREQTRQQLPLSADLQLDVFREFAEMTAKGEPRNTETLRFVFEVMTGLEANQINELTKKSGKFKDHPLIRYVNKTNNWVFTQDQIEYVLLAEKVLALSEMPNGQDSLALLLNHQGFSKSLQAEVATSIVQQIFEPGDNDDALARCKSIIAAISGAGSLENIKDSLSAGCHAFAGQLALFAAAKAYARGADRQERTSALLNLLPQGQLVGLHFVGTMTGFDLRGLTISDCLFDTVTFTNCRFAKDTRFVNCMFKELGVANCDQFGLVSWDQSNRLDEFSQRLVDAEKVTAGQRNYGEDNLMADLDYLIRRFLPRETSGFKNIEERNLTRGLIGHSQYRDLIIDLFKKNILESYPVSGFMVYSVLESLKNDFIFYIGNGVFTGELAKLKDEIRRKVGLVARA
jgi:Cdc6-like AAA superfamily ATPase